MKVVKPVVHIKPQNIQMLHMAYANVQTVFCLIFFFHFEAF